MRVIRFNFTHYFLAYTHYFIYYLMLITCELDIILYILSSDFINKFLFIGFSLKLRFCIQFNLKLIYLIYGDNIDHQNLINVGCKAL